MTRLWIEGLKRDLIVDVTGHIIYQVKLCFNNICTEGILLLTSCSRSCDIPFGVGYPESDYFEVAKHKHFKFTLPANCSIANKPTSSQKVVITIYEYFDTFCLTVYGESLCSDNWPK